LESTKIYIDNFVPIFNQMRKTILIFGLLCLNVSHLFASEANFSGKIRDAQTGELLSYATISLSSSVDSSFSIGVISNENGFFQFKNIPFGFYQIEVSYMSYKKLVLNIELNNRKHFMEIKLTKKRYELSDAEVFAEKELIEQSPEKITVNISKNTSLEGGNALEVMASLPSVDIDVNGQISYRGSNRVNILLNGKPSELVKNLEQIPVDQIEKIEIINNPSARYEADGMSGIINIVLKSNKDELSRTSLNLFLGLPQTFGGSLGYYEKRKAMGYFANGSFKQKKQFQTKQHWRYNFENLSAFDYYQYDQQDQVLNNLLINTGMDYKIHPNHTIAVSFIASGKLHPADRSINYQSLDKQENVIYNSIKDIDITLKNFVLDGNLDYQFQLSQKQVVKVHFNYNYLDQSQEMDFDFYPVGTSTDLEHDYQNTVSDQLNKSAKLNLDFSQSISDSALFESGYSYFHEDLLNDFNSSSYDYQSNSWLPDTALANRFRFLQNVHAVYLNYVKQLKTIGLQVGLRGEYTTADRFIKPKESYFDLFPSIMLSKKLDKYFSISVYYNRRINRPILKMINPYTNEYADILNIHIGNPDLKPEYVNSMELASRFTSDVATANASIYYRHINQAISRIKSASNDSALVVTFMNLDQAQLWGMELSFTINGFTWWQINANLNAFQTSLVGTYGPNLIEKTHFGWTGSLNNRFKLPWKLQMQWYFYYKSELPDVLGTYQVRYYADFALSRKIWNNKGTLIFKISDVFDTYRYGLDLLGIDENGSRYSQINRRKNESQYFILSFVYNFKSKEKKKKENFFLEKFSK
jgi:hypothetical protein